MKKTLLFNLALMALMMFTSARAQMVVTGKVLSADDRTPLPGVNILVKGTTQGTSTDVEGNYRLEVPNDATLLFSFVGYVTEEILVGSRSVIDLSLTPDVNQLQEIVIVGYGTLNEKDLTSAITTIETEEIVKTPTAQAMQALQGKVPGVQIVSSGAPGAAPTVRVRGIGSFEAGGAPLYVVDGMFFDNIDFLSTNDIASITVLKDASAAAIYGNRAANGVILIETKTGEYNQAPEIVYDGYVGIQVPQNVIQMANAEQYVQYVNETGDPADISFVDNAFQRYGRSRINPNVPNVNTDWYDQIMEPASIQNHSLSFTGGGERSRYSIGASYFSQEGLLESTRNEYNRLNFRVKMDFNAADWLTVGGNLNVSIARQYVGENAAWFQGYFAVPILPVFDEQNVDAFPDPLGNARELGYRGRQNPFYSLLYNDNRNDIGKVLGNFYLDFEILPNKLSFKTAYNYNLEGVNARNVDFEFSDAFGENIGALTRNNSTVYNQIWDNYLTYNDNFGNHNITAVAGYSYRSFYRERLIARGEEFNPPLTRDQEELWYLSNATNIDVNQVNDANDGTIFNRLFGQSFFGRLAYNYNDRYLVYATLRADGSNAYQEKWGVFPTVGAGWVISEENFFNVNFINFLKVRGGWGQLGNDAIRPAEGAPTVEDTETAINDVLVNGLRVSPTFNRIEQWEVTEEINIGISSRFLNNRLTLEADYFIRDTKDLAVSIIPPVFRDTERRSVGEIRNQGVELALNWSDQLGGDFTYTVGGNIATLNNEVRSLGGPLSLDAGQAEFRQRSIVGEPFEAFFGYEVAGVFQNEEEITNSGYTPEFITDNALVPGDFFFRDQNGDGIINDEDRVVLGSFLPEVTYGFNLGVSYKNIGFSANFQGQVGHEILNRKRGEIIFTNDTNLDADLVNNLWRGEGTSNIYPSAAGLRRGWNQNMSSYFVESGSYFRIQNVQLSYSLIDKEFLGAKIPRTTVTLTAERPLTVFNYNGFNPEVPNGIDRQVYPIPAVYTIGLNVKI